MSRTMLRRWESRRGGGNVKVTFDRFKECYKDEYTGEKLPAKLVQDAIADELKYFCEVVWEVNWEVGLVEHPEKRIHHTNVNNNGAINDNHASFCRVTVVINILARRSD